MISIFCSRKACKVVGAKPFCNIILTLAVCTMLSMIALFSGSALAANSPASQSKVPSLDQFKKDVQLSEEIQAGVEVQSRFQSWFMKRVADYVNILEGSSVSSLVNLGSIETIRSRLAPPAGSGDWLVIWKDKNGMGPTKEPGEPFYFPSDSGIESMYETGSSPETIATCWHEVQHGFLGPNSLSAPGFHAADQEHFYIEGLAQNTVEWLWWLNYKYNFEKLALKAGEEIEKLQQREGSVPYDVERQIWSKAHTAWRMAWDKKGKNIVSPEDSLREEYARLSGVRVPPVEDVIKFYVQGGVKNKTGQAIPVPEWVTVSDPIRAVVTIEKTPGIEKQTPPEKGGALRHAFDFILYEVYRSPKGMWKKRPVNRGILDVLLENGDDDSSIYLSQDGKRINGISGPGGPSNTMYSVELNPPKESAGKIRPYTLTFAHKHPELIRGKKSYKVSVRYRDQKDAKGETLYHSSSAVYWIDLTGKEKKTTRPTTAEKKDSGGAVDAGGASSEADDYTGAGGGQPVWILTREWVETENLNPTDYKKVKTNASGNSATISVSTPDRNGMLTIGWKFSWSVPDKMIPARSGTNDKPNKLVLTVEKVEQPAGMEIPWGCNMYFYDGWLGPTKDTSRQWRHFGASYRDYHSGKKTFPVSAEYSWLPVYVSPGEEKTKGKQVLHIKAEAGAFSITGRVRAFYEYTYQPGVAQEKPPEKEQEPPEIAVEMRSEKTETPEIDKRMDNQPPEPGEVVRIAKGITLPEPPPPPPLPKAVPSGNWYNHPSGDYKFPLPKGWQIAAEDMDGSDVVVYKDDSVAVFCVRAVESVDPAKDDKEIDRLIAGRKPGQSAARALLGGKKAVTLSYPDKDENSVVRTIHLFNNGRAYNIILMSEPGKNDQKILDPAFAMIEGIRFIR